jgi:hypothetical protein
MATYASSSSSIAVLKELYVDNSDFMKDLVYSKNPLFALNTIGLLMGNH